MSLLQRLIGRKTENQAERLYQAIVAKGREPHWYEDGAVPDTVNGRFDMIASVLAMVMLRIENEPEAAVLTARLTECFVADMDAQLRQIGIGDVVVGKGIGKVMGLLGGRIAAFRDSLPQGDSAFDEALVRNLYRGENPGAQSLDHVAQGLRSFGQALQEVSIPELIEGTLP